MQRILVLLLCAGAACAQPDPLQAPECRAALQALQVAEQTASAPALRDARRHAARACLGTRADPPPSARRAEERVAVPPVRIPAPPSPPPPAARPPAAVLPARPPLTPQILACDAASCLTSDGRRLDRAGAGLVGPQGHCSVQGNLVQCP